MKVMLDAWSSWDVPYTLRMAKLMEEYDPHWFEEPVLSDLPKSHARQRRESPVKISVTKIYTLASTYDVPVYSPVYSSLFCSHSKNKCLTT
jgi:L-alanine-DL-glutamate epimerase-like enolase superfamily enzyme